MMLATVLMHATTNFAVATTMLYTIAAAAAAATATTTLAMEVAAEREIME